ncbi:MAG: ATP-binding protein, partial [Sphingomonas parapaucimobilis]
DPVQAEMALLNIVTNSREAIGRRSGQGEITISTRNMIQSGESPEGPANLEPGEYVMVRVADDGPGIDTQIADKIFDPFFTTKEMGKGAGLGLAMVYGFMRQSGGLATVETDADGAAISLYFPRAAGVTERRAAPVQAARSGGVERVLMVEDQQDVGDLGKSMLEDLGYDVVLTRSAREALDHLAQDSDFALLFTDILMPGGMNGVGLAQVVRRDYPHLSVLLTTGFADEAIDEGARSYELIRKPYRRADLNERIRAVLDRPGART